MEQKKGKFYAVGIGVGDPMDMTVKAVKVLERADVIVIPVKKSGEVSTAYNIASQIANIEEKQKLEIVFPMKPDTDYKSLLEKADLSELLEYLKEGKIAAMVTLGDVSIYSTAAYLKQYIYDKGYDTEVVAGISSYSASAAKAGINLCEGKETVCIVPAVISEEEFKEYFNKFDTLVIMKAGKALKWLIPFIEREHLINNTLMCCNVGMQDEYIGKLKYSPATYFTTLLIKKGKEIYI